MLRRLAACVLLSFFLLPALADAQIPGPPGDGDRFGSALAVGDFNGDGEDDLAVGAKEESVGTVTEAGAVTVVYGRGTGIDISNAEVWHQDTPGVLGVAEAFDWFGAALAAGDFDGDGYDDLAVGVPYENIETIAGAGNAGVVQILYGSAFGLTATGDQFWDQSDLTYTNPEPDDHFGAALTSGDYNGDGADDLAVGSPQEDLGAVNEAGVVHVMFGRVGTGLTAVGNQAWRRSASHGSPGPFDWFGHALASGDFDGDGRDDFAASMVGYDAGGAANAGGVVAFYGQAAGGMNPGTAVWSQDWPGINGIPEPGDQFGFSLASADFDADGFDDLAVGVPYEDDGAVEDAGAVNVLYGSASGLAVPSNQLFTQNTAGVVGVSQPGDRFGYALAAGRIDVDAPADLAVGVEGENLVDVAHFSIDDAGTVVTIAGSIGTGLDPTVASRLWRQGRRGVHDRARAGDRFGAALAIGDFYGDGAGELAVGVPDENIDGATDAGAVNIITGGLSGAIDTEGDLLYQGYDLLLSITPLNPPGPVVEVEQGGQFRFRGALTRLSANHGGMDYWTVAITPNGSQIGPLLGPGTVQVPAGGSGSATFNQRVAPNEATGVFEYRLKVGYYPSEVLATAVLPVRVISSSRTAGERLAAHGGAHDTANEILSPFLEEATPAVWVVEGPEASASAPQASSTVSAPETAGLHAAYPNPFRAQATLGFSLPEAASVRLAVFDALGREVAVVVEGAREAGTHAVAFNGAALPAGIYLVRFEAGGTVQTQRLTLTR